MIQDIQNQFSKDQAVTATALGTNVIDLGAARDIGAGQDVVLHVLSKVAATAAGAATVTITLENADDAAISTNATVLATTSAIPKASLTANTYQMQIVVPRALVARRFLGVRYTVATGPLTAGTFDAFLALQGQDLVANPAPGQA